MKKSYFLLIIIGLVIIAGLSVLIYRNSATADVNNYNNYCSKIETTTKHHNLSTNAKYTYGNNSQEYVLTPVVYDNVSILKNAKNQNPNELSFIVNTKVIKSTNLGGNTKTTFYLGNPTDETINLKNPTIVWRQGTDYQKKIKLVDGRIVLKPGEFIYKSIDEYYPNFSEKIYPKITSELKNVNTWFGPYNLACFTKYLTINGLIKPTDLSYEYNSDLLFNFKSANFSDPYLKNLAFNKVESLNNQEINIFNSQLDDAFSSSIDGELIVASTKNYFFETSFTNSVKITIDGKTLLEDSNKYKTTTISQNSISLEKDKIHKVHIEFSNVNITPVLKFKLVN